MKKFIVFVCCLCCIVVFCGCDYGLIKIIKQNISDLRTIYFLGECQSFYVDLSCGKREQNFAYDGISTTKLPCGVLSLQFKNNVNYNQVEVTVSCGDNVTAHIMEKSPFENKYMVDLENEYNCKENISVTIKNTGEKCKLVCLSDKWDINYNKALKIAVYSLRTDIEKQYFNHKMNAEFYLKIINNFEYKNPFWFFSYINRANQSKKVLINTQNGDVTKMFV